MFKWFKKVLGYEFPDIKPWNEPPTFKCGSCDIVGASPEALICPENPLCPGAIKARHEWQRDHGVDDAIMVAKKAHEGQVRKYTGEPYVNHPIRVSNIVATYEPEDYALQMAAVLHDVIEDTSVIYDDIAFDFGKDIADLVLEVTNQSKKEDGNRETRKAIDRWHLSKASPRGQTMKLADIFDNVSDIRVQNPGYAVKYIAEKKEVLPFLRDGNAELYARVLDLLYEQIP